MSKPSGGLAQRAAERVGDLDAQSRRALVARLRPALAQMQRDADLALAQLDGPDPEAALVTLAGAVESLSSQIP